MILAKSDGDALPRSTAETVIFRFCFVFILGPSFNIRVISIFFKL